MAAGSAPELDAEGTHVSPDIRGDVYVAIAARRTAFDTLMWQVPVLSLTAQAFLLTIALGPDSSRSARCVASLLALVTSVVAIQTMAKHRHNERTDALMLEELEKSFGVCVGGTPPHAPLRARGLAVGNRLHGPLSIPSFSLWVAGLVGFALAALAVIVLTAVAPQLL